MPRMRVRTELATVGRGASAAVRSSAIGSSSVLAGFLPLRDLPSDILRARLTEAPPSGYPFPRAPPFAVTPDVTCCLLWHRRLRSCQVWATDGTFRQEFR